MSGVRVVRSASELLQAVQAGDGEIEVQRTLSGMPMITLGPGVKLRGGTLKFGAKGVWLTSDNELDGVTVLTPMTRSPSSTTRGSRTSER